MILNGSNSFAQPYLMKLHKVLVNSLSIAAESKTKWYIVRSRCAHKKEDETTKNNIPWRINKYNVTMCIMERVCTSRQTFTLPPPHEPELSEIKTFFRLSVGFDFFFFFGNWTRFMLIAAILVVAIYTHPICKRCTHTRVHRRGKTKTNKKKTVDAVTDASLVALLMTIESWLRFVCPQCRKLFEETKK